MNKRQFLLFFFIFLCFYAPKAQEFAKFLKENAIEIQDLNQANEQVYAALKPFRCIMVGEMHGTQEPALFVESLLKSLKKEGQKVLLGIEIPMEDMEGFRLKKAKKTLLTTNFFSKGYQDGRNNAAWFDLITAAAKQKGVHICFFDSNKNNTNRDSMMFEQLKVAYAKDTTQIMLTISGNIHNMTLPFRGEKTLACYLTDYFSSKNLASINHYYDNGTMNNNNGSGLVMQQLSNKGGPFASATALQNYLLVKYPAGFTPNYNMILFTRKVTAALPVMP